MKSQGNKAFTLVELLIVISIIGALASIFLVYSSNVRAVARDTNRIAQIVRLKEALQLYYLDYNSYPSTNGQWSGSCPAGTNYIPGLAPEYIPELPLDPSNCKPAFFAQGEFFDLNYVSDGNFYILAFHNETRDKRFAPFFDPYDDGGPNTCIVDGDNITHFSIRRRVPGC